MDIIYEILGIFIELGFIISSCWIAYILTKRFPVLKTIFFPDEEEE